MSVAAKTKLPAHKLAGRLRHAAATGNLARVRKLLQMGATPDRRATRQPTPLIAAASAGHLPVVKELLAAGADSSFAHRGQRGTTALREAILHRRFKVASALIAVGANVHHDWTGKGTTIASEAAHLCNKLNRDARGKERRQIAESLKIVAELLRAGGKIKPGLLTEAAIGGNRGLVRLLLDSGFDINEGRGGTTPLAGAVYNDEEDIAVELLERGADPWADDRISGPALHQAVVSGLRKVVQGIIKSKADLNRRGTITIGKGPPPTLIEDKDSTGRVVGREWKFHSSPQARNATAPIVAVRVGKLDMVRLLANGGADLEATDGDGFTPLAWALKLKNQRAAGILRRGGAIEPAHLEGAPRFALVTAATTGDLIKVRAAITAGADVNGIYDTGRERYTALMKASEGGHLAVIEELLNRSANPDTGGLDNRANANVTPLMLASRHGHTVVVKRLLEAGARPETQQINLAMLAWGPHKERGRPLDAAIHEAANAGHTDIVKLLIEAGTKPMLESGASGTVFQAAAASGNKSTVETVLAGKEKESSAPRVSADVLLSAIQAGNPESVRALIAAGADVNASTRDGDTALGAAAASGDTQIVKLLLDAGARPSRRPNKALLNELMEAASGGYPDIVQMLLDAGADINEQRADGETALHWAASNGHPEVVVLLLKAGASTKIRNFEGKTALQDVRQIIRAWSGKSKRLRNMPSLRRCAKLLAEAERRKRH